MKMMSRPDRMFAQIRELCFSSFSGAQLPPLGVLRYQYDTADVFVDLDSSCSLMGFAIVTEKAGKPYIWSIAVEERHRGTGVGSRLLREIIENYGGADYIELICRFDNPAQKLYFDLGWRVVSVAKGFYGNEGDGLVMRSIPHA